MERIVANTIGDLGIGDVRLAGDWLSHFPTKDNVLPIQGNNRSLSVDY